MPPSITDIAKRVGVSHQVVSKVLNGGSSTTGASAKTRQRILDTASEMGYRPDAAGRALRRGSLSAIGVLMGGWDSFHLPQELLGSFSKTIGEQGYSCTLVCTDAYDAEHLSELPILANRMVDAMMISYARGTPPALTEKVRSLGIPVVWLNEHLEENAVIPDEADASRQLVRHLAELGHKRVEFVDFSTGDTSVPYLSDRLQGFAAEAEAYGIEALQQTHRAVSRDQRFNEVRRWLARENRPTAVIVNSLSAAQSFLNTALYMGIRVPQDLTIASFDNGRNNTANTPKITCAIRPDEEIGRIAAEMALKRVKHPKEPLKSRRPKFTLDCGGSTDIRLHPGHSS